MKRIVALSLVLLTAAACASTSANQAATEAEPARTAAKHASAPTRIVAAPGGETVAFDLMMAGLDDERVVYIGEHHNNDHHHAVQLQVVKAMYEQSPRLMIGMEMFQRPSQAALDAFVLGDIDEKEMLRRTEYFTRWGWDYMYYRPMLLFARENGIPVIALNAPTEVRRKVGKTGLDSLTPGERTQIAEEIDLTIEAHRAYLKEIFESHPMGNRPFDNFYAAQCVWEDTMAEAVADALAERQNSRMVVIVGGGHVRQRYGIPVRAEKRGASPYSILLGTVDGEHVEEYLANDYADYLIVTAPAPKKSPTPKLGFRVDATRIGEGVHVKTVIKGSLAELAGMKAGDQILSANGTPIVDMHDVYIFVALNRDPTGTVEVLRDGERRRLIYDVRWRK